MTENPLILTSISVDELKEIIRSCLPESRSNATTDKEDSIFLTIKEAAEFLKVSEISIHTWKKSKGLKYYRVGRRIRFKKQDLIDFANLKRRNK